jgi:hypothetical protein
VAEIVFEGVQKRDQRPGFCVFPLGDGMFVDCVLDSDYISTDEVKTCRKVVFRRLYVADEAGLR